jgi:predicted O-methyltransferase YrrM
MTIRNTIKERWRDIKFHESLIPVRRFKKSLEDAYPSLLLRWSRKRRETLLGEFRRCSTVQECIEFTRRHTEGGSIQIAWEIESAIRLIADARPQIMCEIGTFDGGTSLLFSKFLPTVEVMLCMDLYVKNKELLRLLASPGQQLHFFDMPSCSDRTLDKVRKLLNGRMIDALFIDGDHRYDGVKNDFLCYRSFVRDGGLIMFHDIAADKGFSRAWAGGVPTLWKELSPYYSHREFVQSRDQEGYGIGVLTYSRSVQPPVVM